MFLFTILLLITLCYSNRVENMKLISITKNTGITKFIDLSFNDFSFLLNDEISFRNYTDKIEPYSISISKIYPHLYNKLSFNWVEKSVVKLSQDQGNKGISWAISSKNLLESIYYLSFYEIVSIDIYNIINCVKYNSPYWVFEYGIISNFLITSEERDNCIDTKNDDLKKIMDKVSGIYSSANIFKSPFIIDLYVDNKFQHYTGGLLDMKCKTDKINYSALVVGFSKENNVIYWIASASFGTKWGENGFFKIPVLSNCIEYSYSVSF